MQNYNTMLAGLQDLVDNPTPRIPVALCLDVSGSMCGEPIRELGAGVQQFLCEMRDDDLTLYSVETALITFSSTASCIADFNTADRLQPPAFTADGNTCMGEGLTLALDKLQARKELYKSTGVDYYQPILVVMSDGAPNGSPQVLNRAAERIAELADRRRLTVIAVGIGEEADMTMLQKVSPKRKPVRLNHLQFREFFSWLSSSVAQVSASLPGDEPQPDDSVLRALEAEAWPDETL